MRMRVQILAASLLLASIAFAGDGTPLTLKSQQTRTIEVSGVTAAYSLSPSIVDAALSEEGFTISGRTAGNAKIVLVRDSGVEIIDVTVEPSKQALRLVPGAGTRSAIWEVRYDSAVDQIQNIAQWNSRHGDSTFGVYVNYATSLDGTNGRNAIPSAWIRFASPGQELILLDQNVRNTPLTVDGRTIRGIHYRNGLWQFHGGYTYYSTFQNILLSDRREGVLGASYTFQISDRASLQPNLYVYPTHTQRSQGPTDGVVGSLAWDWQPSRDLRLFTEVGASRRLSGSHAMDPGAAIELRWNGVRDRVQLESSWQPGEFAMVGSANRGFRSNGSWRHQLSRRLLSDLWYSANRFELPTFEQTNVTSNYNLRYRFDSGWYVNGGAAYSRFDTGLSTRVATESISAPLGAGFSGLRGGANTELRYTRSTTTNDGGTGIRIAGYRGSPRFRVSAYAERQTQAPTLDYIFTQLPGLELALRELGLSASSPGEIAQFLRENQTLIDLGYIQGVTVNLSPLQYRAGATLRWAGSSASRQQILTSLQYTRNELVNHTTDSAVATLAYSRRLSDTFDLDLSYSAYASKSGTGTWDTIDGVRIMLRHQFENAPSFGTLFTRHGTIDGMIFLDPDGTGTWAPSRAGLPGVEIVLDGTDKTETDQAGRFVFRGVPSGPHEVEATFDSSRPFRFTTSPLVQAEIGDAVRIGVAWLASRLVGSVRSDDGRPIRDVQLTVRNDDLSTAGRTDALGKTLIPILRAGTYNVELDPMSIPAGYRLSDPEPQQVRIEEKQPSRVEFVLHALRSVGGRALDKSAHGAEKPLAGVVVRIDETGATCTTDSEGRYLFRRMNPGVHTLRVDSGDLTAHRSIDIPVRPTTITGIDLEIGTTRSADGRRTPSRSEGKHRTSQPAPENEPAASVSLVHTAPVTMIARNEPPAPAVGRDANESRDLHPATAARPGEESSARQPATPTATTLPPRAAAASTPAPSLQPAAAVVAPRPHIAEPASARPPVAPTAASAHEERVTTYVIKVGAFANAEQALDARNKLAALGIEGIVTANRPIRVEVGPLTSLEESTARQSKIHSLGLHSTLYSFIQ